MLILFQFLLNTLPIKMQIAPTYFSPSVYVSDIELFCIGNFWMEDSYIFFDSIKKEILRVNPKDFTVKFSIHHIHSSGVKQLFEFLKFIKNLKTSNEIEKLQITFYYLEDDADLGELLNDMAELIELKFNVFVLPEKKFFFS